MAEELGKIGRLEVTGGELEATEVGGERDGRIEGDLLSDRERDTSSGVEIILESSHAGLHGTFSVVGSESFNSWRFWCVRSGGGEEAENEK